MEFSTLSSKQRYHTLTNPIFEQVCLSAQLKDYSLTNVNAFHFNYKTRNVPHKDFVSDSHFLCPITSDFSESYQISKYEITKLGFGIFMLMTRVENGPGGFRTFS